LSANAADPAIGADLGTGHFLLYVEVLDAEETGRFLEATYAEMKRFFADVEPDRKLQVKIYATKERYQLEMDRLRRVFSVKRKARDTHGLYLRETACAYLYLQPEEYETRQLLVHEVAHEYHDAIREKAARTAGHRSERPMMDVAVAGGDEAAEERVGPVGLALELGMKLAGDKERVIFDLDHLHQLPIW
jgi:hypothetical protein